MPVTEFVAGWQVVQTLGEGAFGEVKLLIEQNTGEAVAMKVVDLEKHPNAGEAVKKEMALHRMLKHENIIKFFGSRKDNCKQYMFLEYAVGGELFDRIEPDVGMDQKEAQKYFRALVDGVEFIHTFGVAHRDLKPENLLLDANDVLKITDFGMATLFRYNGKERLLERKCGTKPYIAPEVLFRPYSAQPADIWSCGVILVALVAGELPWDEPTMDCREYVIWKDRDNFLSETPWKKMDNLVLSLLRKVLNTVPKSRATISMIKKTPWFMKHFEESGTLERTESSARTPIGKRVCSVFGKPTTISPEDTRLAISQPLPQYTGHEDFTPPKVMEPYISFSQPANPDHLLLSTQLSEGTQTCYGSQTHLQRQVRRMTRILVNTSLLDTITHLETLFNQLNYASKRHLQNVITITTVDRRGTNLVFKATLLDMGAHILVDFRLSKGCGLDFKRQFLKVKKGLCDIIIKGPVTWTMALATNTLPS